MQLGAPLLGKSKDLESQGRRQVFCSSCSSSSVFALASRSTTESEAITQQNLVSSVGLELEFAPRLLSKAN